MICSTCNGTGVAGNVFTGYSPCWYCMGHGAVAPGNVYFIKFYRGYCISHVDGWYRAYKGSPASPGSYALMAAASTEEGIEREIDRTMGIPRTETVCETQEEWVTNI